MSSPDLGSSPRLQSSSQPTNSPTVKEEPGTINTTGAVAEITPGETAHHGSVRPDSEQSERSAGFRDWYQRKSSHAPIYDLAQSKSSITAQEETADMTVGICAPYLRNAGTDEEPDWVINSPTWDGLTLGGSLSAWILRCHKAHQTDIRRASAMHRAGGHGITITTKRTTKDREPMLHASARTRNVVHHLPIPRPPGYYDTMRRRVRHIGDLALSFQHP